MQQLSECPICFQSYPITTINGHVEICLSKQSRKDNIQTTLKSIGHIETSEPKTAHYKINGMTNDETNIYSKEYGDFINTDQVLRCTKLAMNVMKRRKVTTKPNSLSSRSLPLDSSEILALLPHYLLVEIENGNLPYPCALRPCDFVVRMNEEISSQLTTKERAVQRSGESLEDLYLQFWHGEADAVMKVYHSVISRLVIGEAERQSYRDHIGRFITFSPSDGILMRGRDDCPNDSVSCRKNPQFEFEAAVDAIYTQQQQHYQNHAERPPQLSLRNTHPHCSPLPLLDSESVSRILRGISKLLLNYC